MFVKTVAGYCIDSVNYAVSLTNTAVSSAQKKHKKSANLKLLTAAAKAKGELVWWSSWYTGPAL